VEIGEDSRDHASLGVPEPHLVSDAEGSWRSRMVGEQWEVNDAHEDYRAIRAEGKSRLRYLLLLLAKEIVLRTTGRVEAADVMDSIVEVLAHAERNLRGGGVGAGVGADRRLAGPSKHAGKHGRPRCRPRAGGVRVVEAILGIEVVWRGRGVKHAALRQTSRETRTCRQHPLTSTSSASNLKETP
jgi:hypothetical protein